MPRSKGRFAESRSDQAQREVRPTPRWAGSARLWEEYQAFAPRDLAKYPVA